MSSGLRRRDADEVTRHARTTNLGGYGQEEEEENERKNKIKKWGMSDVYRYDNLRSISVRVRRRSDDASFQAVAVVVRRRTRRNIMTEAKVKTPMILITMLSITRCT